MKSEQERMKYALIASGKALDIDLFEIPKDAYFNINRDWKMSEIEKSKILSIKLMNHNNLILEIKQ